MIRPTTLAGLSEAYRKLDEYYADLRALFDFLDIRFRLGEYGVRLASLAGSKLHSNASGYILSDDSPYPFYLWTPSWLGRFYIDALAVPHGAEIDHCSARKAGVIAFVWPWMGLGDAYVRDVQGQECWAGVAAVDCDDPDRPILEVADMMWKFFRVESMCSGEEDGWLVGSFRPNDIGCTLTGGWFLRRIPMSDLDSFYQLNDQLVRPLSEKYCELSGERHATVGAAPRAGAGKRRGPMEPGDVTPEWIAEHIDGQATPRSAVACERIGESGGLLGRIYRVRYTATENRSFVLKLPPPVGSSWDHLLAELRAFPREVQSYRLFEKELGPGSGLIPACYWSACDEDGSGALALEDLTRGGGFTAPVGSGLSLAQARAALVALARLHALHARDGTQGAFDRPPAEWMYTAGSPPLVRILSEAVDDGRRRLAGSLRAWADETLLDAMARWPVSPTLETTHRHSALLSVCHGDAWSNNVMFVPETAAHERAVLLDWQFTMWGNPLVDVTFLLVSSLEPESREAWARGLLDDYYSALRDGLDPEIPYPREACQDDYDRALPYGVLMSLCNLEAFLSSVDEQEAPAIVRRLNAAVRLWAPEPA